QPGSDLFAAPDLPDGLAFADDSGALAIDENFGRLRPGIVIRAHNKAVGAGAHQGEIISLAHFGQRPIVTEEVARFAYWPNDVGADHRAIMPGERNDFVISLVESRPDQVVH